MKKFLKENWLWLILALYFIASIILNFLQLLMPNMIPNWLKFIFIYPYAIIFGSIILCGLGFLLEKLPRFLWNCDPPKWQAALVISIIVYSLFILLLLYKIK